VPTPQACVGYYNLFCCIGNLDAPVILLIVQRSLPLNAPKKAYFEHLTLVDYIFTVVGASLSFVAAGALFLMRKLAPYLSLQISL